MQFTILINILQEGYRGWVNFAWYEVMPGGDFDKVFEAVEMLPRGWLRPSVSQRQPWTGLIGVLQWGYAWWYKYEGGITPLETWTLLFDAIEFKVSGMIPAEDLSDTYYG